MDDETTVVTILLGVFSLCAGVFAWCCKQISKIQLGEDDDA